tara:strand:+ start:29 stop:1741 length:1713 start_codon:yes stop_codon:yes gene_type:complete
MSSKIQQIIEIITKGAGKSEKQVKGVSGALGGLAKQAGIAAASYFGTRALLNGIKSSIDLFGKQELAEKKLEAALGKTSQKLLNQAKAIQQVTIFGDEQVIEAQALIGSFVKEEEAIAAATKATLDLAAAKGMELTVAADLVSKTLGSSTNALSRYGIEVTGAVGSTERLESLTGNLAEVFGGQATAQANTMSGALAQMSNAAGDAQEALGKTLEPVVTIIAGKMKAAAEAFQGFIQTTTETGVEKTIREIKELGGDTSDLELSLNKIQQSQSLTKLGGESRKVSEIQKDIKSQIEDQNKLSKDRIDSAIQIANLEEQGGFTINGMMFESMSLQEQINNAKAGQLRIDGEIQGQAFINHTQRMLNTQEDFELSHELHNEKMQILQDEMDETNKLNMLKLESDILIGKLDKKEITAEENKQKLKKKGNDFLLKEKTKALSKNFESDQIEAANTAWDMAGHAYAYGAKTGGPFLGALYGGVALSAGLAYAKNIKTAQYGADFIADSPQLMLVGEGSGPEHVQVTPLADPNINGPQGSGMTINIQGSVIGTEEFTEQVLMPQIEEGIRLGNTI